MEASVVVEDPASMQPPPADIQHQAPMGQAQFMHPSAVASMHSKGGSPDLSPRGDLEADDPPTPRMYKSNVPAAAASKALVQQGASHHANMSDNVLVPHPQRYPAAKGLNEEASAVVLHQGHYATDVGHASRSRHGQDKDSQHAVEKLQRDLRSVAWPCICWGPSCTLIYILACYASSCLALTSSNHSNASSMCTKLHEMELWYCQVRMHTTIKQGMFTGDPLCRSCIHATRQVTCDTVFLVTYNAGTKTASLPL